MSLPKPTFSADIVAGVTTNRIRERNQPRPAASPRRKRYRSDAKAKGRAFVTVCVSMPVTDLQVIDEAAEAAEVNRSQFLRDAALAKVGR